MRRKRSGASDTYAPHEPPDLKLQPLQCPACGAPVPLGTAEVASCPYCSGTVPIPDEYRALRDTAKRVSADRAQAQELYLKLGKTPGRFFEFWNNAAAIVGGFFAIVVTIFVAFGWLATLLLVLLLEILLHAAAPHLGIDLVDRFGGGGAYAVFGAALLVLVLLPAFLSIYWDTFVELRETLQASLAARLPSRPGGPSACRDCGAPLDVPPDALGVRCVYCGADNLVAIPAAIVTKVRAAGTKFHRRIRDAFEEERRERGQASKTLRQEVGLSLAGLVILYGLGIAAVWIDSDMSGLPMPPSWGKAFRGGRRLLTYGAVQLPMDREGALKEDVYIAALRAGETLTLQSPNVKEVDGVRIENMSTLIPWSARVSWSGSAGTFGFTFRAPYSGLFRVILQNPMTADGAAGHIRWHAEPSKR